MTRHLLKKDLRPLQRKVIAICGYVKDMSTKGAKPTATTFGSGATCKRCIRYASEEQKVLLL
jgi:hypothetical protein